MEYVKYIQALIEEQKALGAVEEEVVSSTKRRDSPDCLNKYTTI